MRNYFPKKNKIDRFSLGKDDAVITCFGLKKNQGETIFPFGGPC